MLTVIGQWILVHQGGLTTSNGFKIHLPSRPTHNDRVPMKDSLCSNCNNTLNLLWTPNIFTDSESHGALISGSFKISGIKSILSVLLQFEHSESLIDTPSIFVGLYVNFQNSTKNLYKVGTIYKTKKAAKSSKKFIIETIAFNKFQSLNFVGKSDWSMNFGTQRWSVN